MSSMGIAAAIPEKHHMLLLLIGFITPAIIFAIFGIIACLRRGPFVVTDVEDDKDYQLLESSRTSSRCDLPQAASTPVYGSHLTPVGYQHYFPSSVVYMPPSYSESVNISFEAAQRAQLQQQQQVMEARRWNSHSGSRRSSPGCSPNSCSGSSKHIPPNQPRVRPNLSTSTLESTILSF